MIASLAQSIALVAHGNAFLAGGDAPSRLNETNSAFEYVAGLQFLVGTKAEKPQGVLASMFGTQVPTGALVATGAAEWFQYLKASGVTDLRLVSLEQSLTSIPLYVATAFAGFTHWVILSEGPSGGMWWSGAEQRIHLPAGQSTLARQGAAGRIWQVTYTGSSAQQAVAPWRDFFAAREELDQRLKEAIEFAGAVQAEFWREYLLKARAQLNSSSPQPRFYADMFPVRGYSLEARQLLSAAASAWVFGGAGSWNDLSVDASFRPRYERITPVLYDAVMSGILAATNSFDARLL